MSASDFPGTSGSNEGIPRRGAQRWLACNATTFHEPAPAGEWLLLSHHSPYAGRGRSYGRADVFRADGALVASFVQDAMIRPRDGTQQF